MLAEQIKQRRIALGLSRAELAAALGKSVRTVEGWESGRYSLAGDARLLDLALRYLEEHREALVRSA